ncbi:MAG: hypothetical protein LKJ31_01865 [Atopobiaceae bacterium]|jgi:hypothetical protein|nr:hypothetical protein [Atopobiaceae bacterium]
MGMGIIGESVLGDIANAIREQNGGSATYRPADMAAAIAALDGTKSGKGAARALGGGSGVVSDSVFSAIAGAIRSQNGLATKYRPGEMAQAIRDLSWDTGLKPRAVLYNGGKNLELNYLDGPQTYYDDAVERSWELSPTGYASDTDVPWHDYREQIAFVRVDPSLATVSFPDISHWFQGMTALTNVTGFDHISGATKASQTFSGDSDLRSISCDAAYSSSITSASIPFYGCRKLVGGHLTVARDTSGASAFTTGANGLLAYDGDDARVWAYARLYTSGKLEINTGWGSGTTPDVLASGPICVNARYNALGSMPWHDHRDMLAYVVFGSGLSSVEGLCTDYWFYNTKSSHLGFSGWPNLHPVSMEFMFNGSVSLQSLDLRGLDPSTIRRWTYAFAGMSSLTTILVSEGWALPSSLASSASAFYGDNLLVGGNGTKFSSSKTGANMAVIDRAGQPGYLTAG